MAKQGRFEKKIEQGIEFSGVVLLVAISVLTIVQVLIRYIIRIPFMWSEEFIRFLFIWLVWVGATLAIPRGMHMVIEFFRDTLFGGKALIVKFIMQIFSELFLLVVVVKGWHLAESMAIEYHTTFPISVKYKFLPTAVCGGLMFYYLSLELWMTGKKLLAGKEKH